jgi:ribonucleotide reductase alpha subunit
MEHEKSGSPAVKLEMYVTKRDGTREEVSFDKVLKRIKLASAGLDVNATIIAQKTLARIYNGVHTTELDELSARLAISLTATHPDYGMLASRIAVSNHQSNTSPSFCDTMKELSSQKNTRTGEQYSTISSQFIEMLNGREGEIDAAINHDRDFLFDYFGFKTLEKQYLLKDAGGTVVERPQYMYMRVALALWGHLPTLDRALETYELLSLKKFTHATPTLFNAGMPRQQCSSCYLLAVNDDSIAGIYKTLGDCAIISKYAGGIGLHIHNIRAKGSPIRGTNGTSNGIVPMLRVFNNTARYVDQCFTPETLVLTDSGPETICTIVPGQKVRTSTGYHTVLKQVPHNYNGDMLVFTLEGHHTSVTVTGEHPILSVRASNAEETVVINGIEAGIYSIDYNEAKDLQEGDYTVFPDGKLGRISLITNTVYSGTVYDFEIDGPHDYTVAHLGIAHNGGGKRNGSFAMYLEPWHADIEDFLMLKRNTGSEEERARDLFYALWIPDLFMERVEADGEWTLFCPTEAPGLADVWGAEFKELYERYEREGRGQRVSAQKLWFKILDSQIETGTPYLLYKDAANAKSNQQNLGTIKSSNLCVAPETLILTDKGQIPISQLEGKEVNVWNGDKWSKTTVMKTGENQKLITVYLSNGAQITCTPYHKFIMKDSDSIKNSSRIEAFQLKNGDQLFPFNLPTGEVFSLTVTKVVNNNRCDDTYCFNEPENHAGVFNGILTGNCSEIIQYSSPTETAVCNLASLNLAAFVEKRQFNFEELRRITAIAVRNLNRVIDINYYPTPETERSNMRHRPVGLGVQGLADVFAMMRIPWETEKAATLNRQIFEHMYYAAIEQSAALAAEEGPYSSFEGSPASKGLLQPDLWAVTPTTDLDWAALRTKAAAGLRNSLLIAPMPTASTSQICGSNECFEPFTSNIYTRRTLAGEFIVINKYLIRDLIRYDAWSEELKQKIIAQNGSVQGLQEVPQVLQDLYKTAYELKQRTLIDMAADRGAFICQSQSLNLFISDPTYSKLTSMHFYGWRRGLKTGMYYLRTKAPVTAQKFTVDPELIATIVADKKARRDEDEGCLMCSG